MSNSKINSVLEKILYIWLNWRYFFGVFTAKVHLGTCKHTERYSANCWREIFWEIISKTYCEMFCKTTVICSAKTLKDVLKTCWGVSCKTTERFSAKILKRAEKTLKCVLQNWWGEFPTLAQNEQLPCKNSETWYVSSRSWPSILGHQNIISN